MALSKTVDLLLVENVENLGIVGDVVKVKAGYARNFLLPRGFATTPSQELIDQLAERRKTAEAEMKALRGRREKAVEALAGSVIRVERAANDQGQLYGSVSQQDIAEILAEAGHEIRPRDVRIGTAIKRVGEHDISVKPEQDIEAHITLIVDPEGGYASEDDGADAADAGADSDSGDGDAAEAEAGDEAAAAAAS